MKQINGTGNGSVVTIAQRRSLDGFCVTKESAKPYPIDFRNQYGGQECAGKPLQLLIHEHDYRRTIHIYSEKGHQGSGRAFRIFWSSMDIGVLIAFHRRSRPSRFSMVIPVEITKFIVYSTR